MINNNGISVIIAHFAPIVNTAIYRALLKKTIESVRSQNVNFEVEIIVCDDGSFWSKELVINEEISGYTKSEISQNVLLKDLDIDVYLVLPDISKYRGITLKHHAIELAKFNKIVLLDDDHPFVRNYSLKRYSKYLDKYQFVRGRVIGPTGIPQLFRSLNAQGTNYGVTRNFYFKIGGFSKYLFENGFGEDNDILWRAYNGIVKNNKNYHEKACYAGEIITKDLASDRWKDRSEEGITERFEMEHKKEQYLRMNSFVNDFFCEHGVHPFNDNPSRNKKGWVEIPSLLSLFSEIKHSLKYFLYTPRTIYNIIARIDLNARSQNESFIYYSIKKIITRICRHISSLFSY